MSRLKGTGTGVIYRISFGREGAYIGSTVYPSRREKEHLRSLRKSEHKCTHLQHAYNKYGEGCYSFEILESVENISADNVDVLLGKEAEWMGRYQRHNLYNICLVPGSTLGTVLSDEVKKRMSVTRGGTGNGMYGKSHTEEARGKMSVAQRDRNLTGEKNPRYGMRPEIQTITASVAACSKPVLQIDLETGIAIREWGSANVASRELGIEQGSISYVCRGKIRTKNGYSYSSKTAGGYGWRFARPGDVP